MKLREGQFVVTIKDIEKYIERLYERREKKYKRAMAGHGEKYFEQWRETCEKIENAERILESMHVAKAAQVDPTLTRSIPAHPQQSDHQEQPETLPASECS